MFWKIQTEDKLKIQKIHKLKLFNTTQKKTNNAEKTAKQN